MTKSEWYAAYSLYRRTRRMSAAWAAADTNHRKRPYTLKEIQSLEKQIPKSIWPALCAAHRYIKGWRSYDYTWLTAAYSPTPWFENQDIPYVTASHNTQFMLCSSIKEWAANVKQWRALQLAPTMAGAEYAGLAPALGD